MARNNILIGILILLILSSTALAADLCTDSDNGPKDGRKPTDKILTTKGSTKYGIQTKEDICVISKDADVQTSESFFLKEYFCQADTRQHEIFDCRRYGFEKCVDGVCVGEASSGSTETEEVVSDCGNKILEKDKGEECDPPGSVCLDGDDYGMCMENCQCKWHSESGTAGTAEPETEDEQQTTDTEDEEESGEETEKKQETEEDEEEKEDEYPVPDVTVPDVGEPKNFSQEPGMGVTRGIAGFFKKIWNWFISLF